MEGKKISFGFMKTKKADKPIIHNNDDRRDYIECVEEQSIKIVGGEDVPINEPLVIPLKPNTLMKSERFREIAIKVESAIEEPLIKQENDVTMADPLAENETLDQMAERELLQEATKTVVLENPVMFIPTASKGIAEGEIESTLDDYESVPVQEFGVAMLRGMGWKPGQSRVAIPVERASQPSLGQVNTLINLLEKNPALARVYPRSYIQRMKARREWERIAAILNKKGCSKSWKQWSKYWKDKKGAIRRKVSKNKSDVESDFMELSELDERIYALITPSAGDKRPVTQSLQNQQESTVQEPQETEQPIVIVMETQHNDQHDTTTQYNDSSNTITQYSDQPRRMVVNPNGTNVLLAVDPLTSSSNCASSQTIIDETTIPSLEGISPRTLPRNTSRISHEMQTDPPSSRNSARGRRILRTELLNGPQRSSQQSTQFSKIVERFLKIEEQRLEHDRRTTNVLETVTRVVSRVLERDAENNRMMSEAMLSIGEGLKLLAQAVKPTSNDS